MPIRPARPAALLVAAVLLGSLPPALSMAPSIARAEWTPPEPTADPDAKWDWMKIDSGEWLKGEMVVMQGKTLTFDSDEFDEVEFDWEDILDLRLAAPRVFRFTDNRIFTGTGELHEGIVRIRLAGDEVVEFPASDVVSITYTTGLNLKKWTVRIGGNLAARSGNTDQQDIGGTALIRRHDAYTRWESRYNGAFGRVDHKQTTNNHRASTLLDWMVTNRFFVRVPYFEFYKDQFQNIDGRYTTGAGVGYEIVDTKMVEYRLTIGAGGQVSDFNDGTRSSDAAGLLISELSLDLPHDVDFDLRYSLQLLVTDLGRTAHSTSGVLSFEVWEPIDLDVGAYWDRIEEPERDDQGNRPKSDDFRLTVGLSVEF